MIGDDDWKLARKVAAHRHQLALAHKALQATISAAKVLAMVIDDLQGSEGMGQTAADSRVERKLKAAGWWIDEARRTVKGEDA